MEREPQKGKRISRRNLLKLAVAGAVGATATSCASKIELVIGGGAGEGSKSPLEAWGSLRNSGPSKELTACARMIKPDLFEEASKRASELSVFDRSVVTLYQDHFAGNEKASPMPLDILLFYIQAYEENEVLQSETQRVNQALRTLNRIAFDQLIQAGFNTSRIPSLPENIKNEVVFLPSMEYKTQIVLGGPIWVEGRYAEMDDNLPPDELKRAQVALLRQVSIVFWNKYVQAWARDSALDPSGTRGSREFKMALMCLDLVPQLALDSAGMVEVDSKYQLKPELVFMMKRFDEAGLNPLEMVLNASVDDGFLRWLFYSWKQQKRPDDPTIDQIIKGEFGQEITKNWEKDLIALREKYWQPYLTPNKGLIAS